MNSVQHISLSKSQWLQNAKDFYDSKRFELPEATGKILLSGDAIASELLESYKSSDKVRIFLSSTFDDTKFEQDELLRVAYPFLKSFCKILNIDFDVVTMRWGVVGRSGDRHLTSELCMSQLRLCLSESTGPAFVTLQSHRYGYRPFPSVILQDELDSIIAALVLSGEDTSALKEPFWRLDALSTPCVYFLQPVSSLPDCNGYLLTEEEKVRMKLDPAFRTHREKLRRDASGQWWNRFERMQTLLRKGSMLANLSAEEQEKYQISVTHDEVVRAILKNPKANSQSYCFIREIANAHSVALQDPSARAYIESGEAENLEEQLKNQIVNTLSPDRIFHMRLPWVGGALLDKSNSSAPADGGWAKYVADFGDKFVDKVCGSILANYRKPCEDILMAEVLGQREKLLQELRGASIMTDSIRGILDRFVEYATKTETAATVMSAVSADCDAEGEGGSGDGSDGSSQWSDDDSGGDGDGKDGDSEDGGEDGNDNDDGESDSGHSQGKQRKSGDAAAVERGSEKAVVLVGPSGSGKSWLMAQAVALVREKLPYGKAVVVSRFLGTSRDSSDALSLIRSVGLQVAKAYGRLEAAEEVPLEWKQASAWFAEGRAFRWASEDLPLLVALDSLDQLSNAHFALSDLGSWLPGLSHALPRHVRVIISTLPRDRDFHILTSLERFRGVSIVPVQPLDLRFPDAASNIGMLIASRPAEGVILPVKRSISQEGLETIVAMCCLQESNQTPLFLSLSLDIVLRWSSYECDATNLAAYSAAAQGSAAGLIEYIFREAELMHGKLLVQRLLGLLSAARHGLSESELEDILSCDDELLDDIFEWWVPPVRRLPPMLVQRIVATLKPYLVRRGTGRGHVLAWYHRQFSEAARRLYLGDEADQQRASAAIAAYFGKFPSAAISSRIVDKEASSLRFGGDGPTLSGLVNTRLCTELPFAHCSMGTPDGALQSSNLLCTVSFVAAKVDAGLLPSLLEDFLSLLTLRTQLAMHGSQQLKLHPNFDEFWHWIRSQRHRWTKGSVSVVQSALFYPNHTVVYQQAKQAVDTAVAIGAADDIAFVKSLMQWQIGKPLGLDPCVATLDAGARAEWLTCVSYHPNNALVVAADLTEFKIWIWDTITGVCLFSFVAHAESVTCLAFSPDGSLLASGSDDHSVKIWDHQSLCCRHVLNGHKKEITSISWLKDGQRLLSAANDKSLRVWSAQDGTCLITHRLEMKDFTGVLSHGGGTYAAVGSSAAAKNAITLLSCNVATGITGAAAGLQIAPFKKLLNKGQAITRVAWSMDDLSLASGSENGALKIWDVATCMALTTVLHHEASIMAMEYSPSGDQLATASEDMTVCVWRVSKHKAEILATLTGHGGWVTAVSWSRCGNYFATCAVDSCAKIWAIKHLSNYHSGPNRKDEHRYWTSSVAWSPCGSQILSGAWEPDVKLWDAATELCVDTFSPSGKAASPRAGNTCHGDLEWVYCVCWSPDGTTFATGSNASMIRIWRALNTLPTPPAQLNSPPIPSTPLIPPTQPTQPILLSAQDQAMGVAVQKCLASLKLEDTINALCYSPTGAGLASAAGSNIYVSDTRAFLAERIASTSAGADAGGGAGAKNGGPLNGGTKAMSKLGWVRKLQGHSGEITSVSWSTSGRTLLSCSKDESIRVWEVHSGCCSHVLTTSSGVISPSIVLWCDHYLSSDLMFASSSRRDGDAGNDGIEIWQRLPALPVDPSPDAPMAPGAINQANSGVEATPTGSAGAKSPTELAATQGFVRCSVLPCSQTFVESLSWCGHSLRLVCGCNDRSIRVWARRPVNQANGPTLAVEWDCVALFTLLTESPVNSVALRSPSFAQAPYSNAGPAATTDFATTAAAADAHADLADVADVAATFGDKLMAVDIPLVIAVGVGNKVVTVGPWPFS